MARWLLVEKGSIADDAALSGVNVVTVARGRTGDVRMVGSRLFAVEGVVLHVEAAEKTPADVIEVVEVKAGCSFPWFVDTSAAS